VPLWGRFRASLLGLGLAAFFAGGAGAEPYSCDHLPIEVLPGNSELAPRVCDVAAETEAVFAGLGLTLSEPVEVVLTDRISNAPDSCVALYDSETRRLEILTIECLSDGHGGLGSFHDLSPEVFFDSLIVHELTHAYLHQTGADLGRSAHEYLAYALQLDSLPPESRSMILDRTTLRSTIDIDDFDELLLAFHPLRYAAMAWRHFNAQSDRAAVVAAIVSGETQFPTLDR
jgi:hypothetical protein